MTFKDEFRAALEQGQPYQALLDLVNRRMEGGLSPRESYDLLQEIWQEYGFDAKSDTAEGRVQDNLEAIMEKVWFACPV